MPPGPAPLNLFPEICWCAGSGELRVCGPQLFKEYWRRPDATADAFDEQGFFLTGGLLPHVWAGCCARRLCICCCLLGSTQPTCSELPATLARVYGAPLCLFAPRRHWGA